MGTLMYHLVNRYLKIALGEVFKLVSGMTTVYVQIEFLF